MWVVAPPQRPTAAILYSNPHNSPCTLSGDLHGAAEATIQYGQEANDRHITFTLGLALCSYYYIDNTSGHKPDLLTN